MKPLIVLLAIFGLSSVVYKVATGHWQTISCGNIAMGVMLLFTALGHFKFTQGMAMMLPAAVPYKTAVVYGTGIAEIAFGLALFFPPLRHVTGLALIAMLVLMLPANIRAAIRHINYETGASDGSGPRYLLFRIPLQVFFIAWIWYFAVSA